MGGSTSQVGSNHSQKFLKSVNDEQNKNHGGGEKVSEIFSTSACVHIYKWSTNWCRATFVQLVQHGGQAESQSGVVVKDQ